MKFTALLFVVFASLVGCATRDYTDRINTTCIRMPDRKVELQKDCVICYAKGQSVVACTMENT